MVVIVARIAMRPSEAAISDAGAVVDVRRTVQNPRVCGIAGSPGRTPRDADDDQPDGEDREPDLARREADVRHPVPGVKPRLSDLART